MISMHGIVLRVFSSILRSMTAQLLCRRISTSHHRTMRLCAHRGAARLDKRTLVNRMSNIYRIYPQLWSEGACWQAQTVYAIDRQPPPNTFPTQCSRRQSEDPSYWYDSMTFQRILPPPQDSGFSQTCCYQSSSWNAVTWRTLPLWLSYVQSVGYTVTTNLSDLTPFTSIYISGP